MARQPAPGVADTVRCVCHGRDGEVADLFAGPGSNLYRYARRTRDCARGPEVKLPLFISRAGDYEEPAISNACQEGAAAKSRAVALGATCSLRRSLSPAGHSFEEPESRWRCPFWSR